MKAPALTSSALRPEYVFATILGIFGTAFAFIMPPCQTPDEPSHFFRAYRVSEGRFQVHKQGEWGGGTVPVSIARIAERFNALPFHPDRHTTVAHVTELLSVPLEPQCRVFQNLPGSAYYSFVPYLPQAAGMAVARWAGCGPLPIFYAGRLANLALAVILVFWAIRLTPVFSLVIGLVSLLPITVHQFSSHNPDGSTLAVALLLISVAFKLALGGSSVASVGLVSGFACLSVWLTLCKFPYAALTLLYLAVPIHRLGNLRRYALVGCTVFLLVAGLTAGLTQLKKNVPDRLSNNPDVSMSKQVNEIRARPIRYAKVVLATLAEHSGDYLINLGLLGWLDTRVNPLAMQLFLCFLFVVALADRTDGVFPSLWLKLNGLIAATACMVVILTSCYAAGSLFKAKIIVGPQPRYFVPLLPLFLLPLYNLVIRVHVDRRALLALCGTACGAVLFVALGNVTRRYYFPVGTQLRWSPVILLLAGSMCLMSLWWVRARYAARADVEPVVLGWHVQVESDPTSAAGRLEEFSPCQVDSGKRVLITARRESREAEPEFEA